MGLYGVAKPELSGYYAYIPTEDATVYTAKKIEIREAKVIVYGTFCRKVHDHDHYDNCGWDCVEQTRTEDKVVQDTKAAEYQSKHNCPIEDLRAN